MLKKVRQKQSVLSLVPIMSREEVFKFPDRLGRNCGFTQVAPVSHSPWEEGVSVDVCLAKFNFKALRVVSCQLRYTVLVLSRASARALCHRLSC